MNKTNAKKHIMECIGHEQHSNSFKQIWRKWVKRYSWAAGLANAFYNENP